MQEHVLPLLSILSDLHVILLALLLFVPSLVHDALSKENIRSLLSQIGPDFCVCIFRLHLTAAQLQLLGFKR